MDAWLVNYMDVLEEKALTLEDSLNRLYTLEELRVWITS